MLCAVLCTLCLVLGCAGCVQQPVNSQNMLIEAPEDVALVLDRYADVVSAGFVRIDEGFHILADNLGTVSGSYSDTVDLLREYYADNPWIGLLEYYPVSGNDTIFVPDMIPQLSSGVYVHHNASSFTGQNLLNTGPYYVPEYGDVLEISLPVYSSDDVYCGYVSVFFDSDQLFREFAAYVPELTEYDTAVIDSNGYVLYATSGEYAGWDVSGPTLELGNIYGEHLYQLSTHPEGAAMFHAYTPLYLEVFERITVWKTVDLLGYNIILLVDRPVSPWSVSEDTKFIPDVSGMTKETIALYQYAMAHSKDDTLVYLAGLDPVHAVVAYDMEGNVLSMASGVMRDTGTRWINIRDAYDVPTVRNMIHLAQQGGGYMQKYEPASVGEIPTTALLYLIYVMPVDDSWFITLRTPAKTELSPVVPFTSHDVTSLARNATLYAWESGREAVIADINSGSSQLLAEASGKITDLAAIDMRGNVLANAFVPGDVGKNVFRFTDANGASVGRQYVLSAQGGGGLMYNVLVDLDDPAKQEVRLMYVEPVDNSWFIVAGIELETTIRADPLEMMP
ncbi:MAG: hypothetical protein O0V67_04605 [Methanocorpusculum sp.]|nr:hypothetical protein [Methanocorpusculum sp.]